MKVMIITQVQHKLIVASLIVRHSPSNQMIFDHLLVPRVPVLPTYSILAGDQIMTVITFCHLSWFYIAV